MDTHTRNSGLHILSLLAIFMILLQYSSSTTFGASEEEQLETMVEGAENHLAYPGRSYGYPLEFREFSYFPSFFKLTFLYVYLFDYGTYI
jgi:hypothetical protein